MKRSLTAFFFGHIITTLNNATFETLSVKDRTVAGGNCHFQCHSCKAVWLSCWILSADLEKQRFCYHQFQNPTSRYLLVRSQQWKQQNKVSNLFKVNNKDNRMTSLTSFWWLIIVNFEQISHFLLVFPLLTLNKYTPARYDLPIKPGLWETPNPVETKKGNMTSYRIFMAKKSHVVSPAKHFDINVFLLSSLAVNEGCTWASLITSSRSQMPSKIDPFKLENICAGLQVSILQLYWERDTGTGFFL